MESITKVFSDIVKPYIDKTASTSGDPKTVSYADIVSIKDGAGVLAKDVNIKTEPVQAGSGTPSPDNIRAISGWSSAKVTRTGKNLLNLNRKGTSWSAYSLNMNYDSEGVLTIDGTASETAWIGLSTPGSALLNIPSGNYIFNGVNGGSSTTYQLQIIDRGTTDTADEAIYVIYDGEEIVVPIDSTHKYRVQVVIKSGITLSNVKLYPMIRPVNITDSTFEPYYEEDYTIDLGSTIYGGTLDVTSGVLTVDRVGVDMGSLTWGEVNSRFYALPQTPAKSYNTSDLAGIISSCYQTLAYANQSTMTKSISSYQGYMYVMDSSYSSAVDFTTAVTGQTLVYELATPQVIQLTPTQIRMLAGVNTVYANTGDTQVEYFNASVGNLGEVLGDVQETALNEVTTRAVLGAHNLFPFDLATCKALNTTGTWNNNIYTRNGVEFTVSDDGQVTVSGTASAATGIILNRNFKLNVDSLKIIGCPAGGSNSSYMLEYEQVVSGVTSYTEDYGNGVLLAYNDARTSNALSIIIRNGTAITTPITFKPMICLASDTDPTHQPYAKTNRELTEDIASLKSIVAASSDFADFQTRIANL